MWSLFSRSASASFQYDIGDAVCPGEGRSIFTLHHAKKKGCGTAFSAFVCHGSVHNNTELELARSAVQRLKSLRHPCILHYVDSLESDKAVYLITTAVSPLISWLLDSRFVSDQKADVQAWGIQQILRAVSFLNNDGNLEHCNVNSSSVFVTPGGEWKLGGLEFCRPAKGEGSVELPPNRLPVSLAVYDAPEKANSALWKDMKPWSTDSWGLGCFMWEVFNVTPLVQSGVLRNTTKFPSSVTGVYKQLLSESPARRPKASQVIEQLSGPSCFLDNKLIHTIDFLDNIHIRQSSEKQLFFTRLREDLDNIPPPIVKHKILPAVVTAQQFSSLGSMVLPSLLKMSELCSEPEYQSQVLPTVVQLFASPDRATRLQLLQQMETLAPHMDASTINDKVFPQLCTGFLDANPSIREHTIKSILHLAPKLNQQLLNIEVMKHFARLQAKDEQGGIRTNCTVCLGKIARHLSPTTRAKCLVSAFTRALKDPFPPARSAGVMALATTQHFYPVDQVAYRIVPALSLLTLDPEKNVRDVVFRVLKGFLSNLEKLSENPALKEEMERECESASGAGGWAGWAVGALTSKFYKSNISEDTSATASLKSDGNATKPRAEPLRSESQSSLPRASSPASPGAHASSTEGVRGAAPGAQVSSIESFMQASATDDNGSWSDGEEWQAMEDLPPPAANSGWENESWDPLEVAPGSVKRPSPPTSNSSSNWSSSSSALSASKDERAALREQRKDDRLKQIEAKRTSKGGPLKLGTKKP
ncbi:N-terminal kinase-like protein [Hyalella azteca]|uniref:N-terminal kinase-like protein n=1 Tax=Hyalella azteca TaxID=294128 RepID=A0A979FQ32_HYAAZ|nr:N-terminal kinase-like protein [Hyalella azteca]